MAPLCLSADIRYVGTQKDIYGLRVAQNTIDGHIMNYIYHPTSWLFLPLNMSSVVRASSYMQLACCTRVSVIASRVQICTWVTLRATRVSYASFHY